MFKMRNVGSWNVSKIAQDIERNGTVRQRRAAIKGINAAAFETRKHTVRMLALTFAIPPRPISKRLYVTRARYPRKDYATARAYISPVTLKSIADNTKSGIVKTPRGIKVARKVYAGAFHPPTDRKTRRKLTFGQRVKKAVTRRSPKEYRQVYRRKGRDRLPIEVIQFPIGKRINGYVDAALGTVGARRFEAVFNEAMRKEIKQRRKR